MEIYINIELKVNRLILEKVVVNFKKRQDIFFVLFILIWFKNYFI